MSNTNEQTNTSQPEHQIIADGQVIYRGPDWQQAFLDACKKPEYGTIIHLQNGEPGAAWGPTLHQQQ